MVQMAEKTCLEVLHHLNQLPDGSSAVGQSLGAHPGGPGPCPDECHPVSGVVSQLGCSAWPSL